MDLKAKARLTYDRLQDFREQSDVPAENRAVFLSDVLTDLADAARRQGCTVELPTNPTSLQALNVVTQVLDWIRETSDEATI